MSTAYTEFLLNIFRLVTFPLVTPGIRRGATIHCATFNSCSDSQLPIWTAFAEACQCRRRQCRGKDIFGINKTSLGLNDETLSAFRRKLLNAVFSPLSSVCVARMLKLWLCCLSAHSAPMFYYNENPDRYLADRDS